MSDTYKIIRFFASKGKRIIKTGLTLDEAKAHCKDPETSSTTCTNSTGKRRTKVHGDWFDGFERENK